MLTKAERMVLTVLQDNDTAPVVSNRLGLEKPHSKWVTTALRSLARRGLVARQVCPASARVLETFSPTAKARSALDAPPTIRTKPARGRTTGGYDIGGKAGHVCTALASLLPGWLGSFVSWL